MSIKNHRENVKSNWQIGSVCLIYSRSNDKWFEGRITEIKGKGNDEWLKVKYGQNKTKQIQRLCSDIKPLPVNHPSYFCRGSICMIKSDTNGTWCFGKVIDIFHDKQGEWLTVKYNEHNTNKRCDIQRHSSDIKLIVDSVDDNEHSDTNHSNNSNSSNICLTFEMNKLEEQIQEEIPFTRRITPLNHISDDYKHENLTTPKAIVGVKMVICSLKQHRSVNMDQDDSVPTPVSDKAMFKFYNKIDMGKIRVSSISMDHSFDNYASDDSFTILTLPFQNIEARSIMLTKSMDSETDSVSGHSDGHSDDVSDVSDDSSSNIGDMLAMMETIDSDIIYAKNGYKKIKKLQNILQGELLLVEEIKTKKLFVIKKTEIELFKQNTAINDDGDTIFTSENRLKECEILKMITSVNKDDPMNKYIVKYENWFQTEDDYYLVEEYIESETNLKQFITQCHTKIHENKMTLNEYHAKIKKIFWLISLCIYWLHNEMNCAHLDLFMENIMVINCDFIQLNEKLIINNNISIVLIDFGVSEVFKNKLYLCNKTDLSINNGSYLAPNVYLGLGDKFDACKADMWSLGMIFFEIFVGKPLYEPMEIAQSQSQKSNSSLNIPTKKRKSLLDMGSLSLLSSVDSVQNSFLNNGYIALQHGNLKEYLSANELIQYFDSDSFALLNNLLKINELQRYNSEQVINHKWFNEPYCKTYMNKIKTKQQKQSPASLLKNFPFYTMDMKSI